MFELCFDLVVLQDYLKAGYFKADYGKAVFNKDFSKAGKKMSFIIKFLPLTIQCTSPVNVECSPPMQLSVLASQTTRLCFPESQICQRNQRSTLTPKPPQRPRAEDLNSLWEVGVLVKSVENQETQSKGSAYHPLLSSA